MVTFNLRILDFHQIFLSRLMKQSVIISDKHGIDELPHEFLITYPYGIRILMATKLGMMVTYQEYSHS